jgi:hypothetical protein
VRPRTLACAPGVLVRLAQLRAACAYLDGERPPKPQLDGSLVSYVEGAVPVSFTDEVLAIFAARVPYLEGAYRMRLDRLGELNEAARRDGLPRALVAVAQSPDNPAMYFCVSRAPDAQPGRIVRYDVVHEHRSKVCLEDWLDLRNELLRRGVTHLTKADRSRIDNPLPLQLPRLFAAPKRSRLRAKAPPLRRVSHHTFGEGIVVREIEGGAERKLEIDFAAAGRRVLLERFVELLSG